MDKRDKRVVGTAVAAAIVIAIILLAGGWYILGGDDADPVAGGTSSGTPVAAGGTSSTGSTQAGSGGSQSAGSSSEQPRAPLELAIPESQPSGGSSQQTSGTTGSQQQTQESAAPQQSASGGSASQPTTGSSQSGVSSQAAIPAQSGTSQQTGGSDSAAGVPAATGQTGAADAGTAQAGNSTILTDDQVATLPPIRPPSFDVVRVNELGDAVIAGRAEPRSIVIIYDGDREIGRVAADSRGEWVFVSDRPLTPGQHEIGLLSRSGPQSRLSDQVVVLIAPEPRQDIAGRPSEGDAEREKPLALLVPRDEIGATTVLQSPVASADGDAAGAEPARTGRPSGSSGASPSEDGGAPVSIDVVDYDESGRLIVSGRSAPESDVRLYLDNQYVGTARTEADGSFEVQPADPVEPGVYALRVDEVSPGGSVTARAETPFQRADAVSAAPPGFKQVVVQPGNSLWRLARRVYGEGIQYTVIFQANNAQIRNPDLIYPGQVFNVPEMPTEVPGDPS